MNVYIIGCGWLGKSLGKSLFALGFNVFGSTRKTERFQELSENGIHPFLFDMEKDSFPSLILKESIICLMIPPSTRSQNEKDYLKLMKNVILQCKKLSPSKLIFTSSTSVYPKQSGNWSEKDVISISNTGSQPLYLVENEIIGSDLKDTYILRLAGLCDEDRNPFLWSRKSNEIELPPNEPVNMVHRQDVVSILIECILNKISFGVWNVCADEHPTRCAFYSSVFTYFNAPLPEFKSGEHNGMQRTISNLKLKENSEYQLMFPDPLRFFGN